MSLETMVAVARVITAMASVMTPEQLAEAARLVREFEEDDPLTRKVFSDFADGMDRYAAERG